MATLMKTLLAVTILAHAAVCGAAAKDLDEAGQLKKWALSRCIALFAKAGPVAEDAKATAGGYFENSSSGIEAFTELEALAKAFLARTYEGSAPVDFNTMKCIDLYESRDLDDLASRLAGRR